MKKILVLTVLILALSASMAMAFDTSQIKGFSLTLALPGTATGSDWAYLDTGSVQLYQVNYDGSADVTANFDTATLTGTFGGSSGAKIWSYQYDDPNTVAVDWTDIGFLVDPLTSIASNVPATVSSGVAFASAVIKARDFRVGYSVALTSTYGGTDANVARAGGLANMKVKAVPEASTLVGFGSAFAMAGPGMIGWLRRRKA